MGITVASAALIALLIILVVWLVRRHSDRPKPKQLDYHSLLKYNSLVSGCLYNSSKLKVCKWCSVQTGQSTLSFRTRGLRSKKKLVRSVYTEDSSVFKASCRFFVCC